MSAWEITNSIASVLLPPGCLLLVALAGALLVGRRRRLGIALMAVAWLALYAFAMPEVASRLVRSLEPHYRDPASQPTGQAIIVLGGSLYRRAPEYGGEDTVNAALLMRLRYAAHLYRALGKPILVTGGSPEGYAVSEASRMKHVLEQDYDVPVRWVEQDSTTTRENALGSYRLLHAAGVTTVYLVTHASHMKRARMTFEHAGFTVIPAPTAYRTFGGKHHLVDFLPNAAALEDSAIFTHEALGLVWYRLKFFISSWSSQAGKGVL